VGVVWLAKVFLRKGLHTGRAGEHGELGQMHGYTRVEVLTKIGWFD
jgi:hypothetical protein